MFINKYFIILFTLFAISSTLIADYSKPIIFKYNGPRVLSLYQEAHQHASVVAKIPKGTRWLIQVSSKDYTSGQWAQVSWNRKKGWARVSQLVLDQAAMNAAQKHKHCLKKATRDRECE
ncbi:MAG TPA: hypothetical protein EYH38_07910 [Leucothrix sp.]|nr:hypothetical protein [Leucothrix sp.]